MLKQRILTGLILAPLVLSAVYYLPNGYFALLMAAMVLMGGVEWSRLAELEGNAKRVLLFMLPLSALLLAIHFLALHQMALIAGMLWWSLALVAVLRYPAGADLWRRGVLPRLLAGLAILAPAWASLVLLHAKFGPGYVILVLLMIWGADTGAYFAGRAFGKRKLAPRVSPGKSWEGVLGGLFTSLLVVVIAAQWLAYPGGLGAFLPLAAVVVFISVLGDLTESLFKRMADIKDSGNLLPGHGGMLDRIDSLTAAAPALLGALLLLEALA